MTGRGVRHLEHVVSPVERSLPFYRDLPSCSATRAEARSSSERGRDDLVPRRRRHGRRVYASAQSLGGYDR